MARTVVNHEAEALSLLIARHATQVQASDGMTNRAFGVAGLALAVLVGSTAGVASKQQPLALWEWSLLFATAAFAVPSVGVSLRVAWAYQTQSLPNPDDVVNGIGIESAVRQWCEVIAKAIELNREPSRQRAYRLNLSIVLLLCESAVGVATTIAGLPH